MKRILIAAASLALTASAAAQTEIPRAIADGMYITLAEVRANSEKTYQYFAGAGGSPISEQQFLSVRVPDDVLENSSKSDFLKRLFGLLDADSDGQVTFSEWQNQIDRDLQFADENGDGRITLKELSNARENMSFGDALGMVF